RIAELLAANIVVMAVLFLPILGSIVTRSDALYEWADKAHVLEDELLRRKAVYFALPFVLARFAVYFVAWCGLAWFFYRASREQDETGEVALTSRMESVAPVGMFVLALTITFFAFDTMMSLDPHWFSTIYGVYFFAGCMIAFYAATSLICIGLQAGGRLTTVVTPEHYHDLGKFLFGFTVFWAYIAFSQFMLIWYANIPEETTWFAVRLRPLDDAPWTSYVQNPWAWVGLALPICHFAIPFFGLMSRSIKRNTLTLAFWAVWMLVFHYVDLYWNIMPYAEGAQKMPTFGLIDVGCIVGIGGLWAAGLAFFAQSVSLLPVRDPRLVESLTLRNI
ncbi:MAG: quinol:cytochrome C oxidoreductase, partial [Planctomycetia bacterium]